MLAAYLADVDARRRRTEGPVGILPPPQQLPQPDPTAAPPAQPNIPSHPHTPNAQEAGSARRPRRHTPYGPLPIRPGETVAEQIDAIQQQHHEVASHAYFLTDQALIGKAKEVVEPSGIWGFERAMVERFPSLEKRNFFCIQHHQATALHYDLRLQLRGGTYSWAVPKGFMGLHRTREPNHQAIQTPVHPISYTHHEGSDGRLFKNGVRGGTQLWDIGEYVIDAVQAREADSPEQSSADDPTGLHEENKLWHAINGKRYERDKAGVRQHKKPTIHITLKNGKKMTDHSFIIRKIDDGYDSRGHTKSLWMISLPRGVTEYAYPLDANESVLTGRTLVEVCSSAVVQWIPRAKEPELTDEPEL